MARGSQQANRDNLEAPVTSNRASRSADRYVVDSVLSCFTKRRTRPIVDQPQFESYSLDLFRDIYDSISQRLRSPFWGYILVSFIFLNWKPLYFLFFADVSVLEKFSYFDETASYASLFALPVLLGVAVALLAPYVSNFGSWWAQEPTAKRRLREIDLAHQLASKKGELLAERDKQRHIVERALLEGAQLDQEAKSLDDDVREELQSKIGQVREEFYDSIGALDDASPVDPHGSPNQLSDVVAQVNANWESLLHTRLSQDGRQGRTFGFIKTHHEELPDVMRSIRQNYLFAEADGQKRETEGKLIRVVRPGDLVFVSPKVDILKPSLDKLKERGATVIRLS